MSTDAPSTDRHSLLCLAVPAAAVMLSGCATLGSVMSPYSGKFACKNSDHGQCIHPEKAYADAVAGVASRSDPAVTRDKKLLGQKAKRQAPTSPSAPSAFAGYRESIYHELQGLIDAPVTPMLRQGRTVRTLVMPYADVARPDRLYMPRYIYSILERPQWVVGDYLVDPVSPAARAPVLGQVKEKEPADRAAAGEPAPVPAMPQEPGQ